MFKRVNVFLLLAVLSVISLLGTGFALWSFTSQASATQNLGVQITQSTVLGSFNAPELKYAVLDGGTGSGINPTITGVSFYKAAPGGKAVTDNSYTISFAVKDIHKSEIKEADNSEKVHFGLRIDVPKGLEGVIEHTDFYTSRVGGNGYIDLKALAIELTDHFNDSDYTNSDYKFDPETCVFTFYLTTTTLNRFFTYTASREPDSLENYDYIGVNFAPYFVLELWQGYDGTS